MKFIYCLIAAAFLAMTASAQDVAKNDKPAPKAETLPATVELTAEQTKTVKDQEKMWRLASLEVENLQLKLQQAQTQLKELQEKAQGEQKALGSALASASKIPLDKMADYDIGEKDGKIVFTKKTAPPK